MNVKCPRYGVLESADSINVALVFEQEGVKKQVAKGMGDEKLSQTISLTVKRLDTYQQVCSMYYSKCMCRIANM